MLVPPLQRSIANIHAFSLLDVTSKMQVKCCGMIKIYFFVCASKVVAVSANELQLVIGISDSRAPLKKVSLNI